VSKVVWFTKGKSAIHLERHHGNRKLTCAGQNFWARIYFVSTVCLDEATTGGYRRILISGRLACLPFGTEEVPRRDDSG
jgi:hypothetical protein